MWRREMGRRWRYFLLILYNFGETLNLQKYFEHFREDAERQKIIPDLVMEVEEM